MSYGLQWPRGLIHRTDLGIQSDRLPKEMGNLTYTTYFIACFNKKKYIYIRFWGPRIYKCKLIDGRSMGRIIVNNTCMDEQSQIFWGLLTATLISA